ncbi:MAG: hypothetical protein D6706_05840 [Chloroflexi bacterium]|nr:MAG: hypothetical protein D6706_05840 [Chloroflexota bacterium]
MANNIMPKTTSLFSRKVFILILLMAFLVAFASKSAPQTAYIDPSLAAQPQETVSVIVTGNTSETAAAAISRLGGKVTSNLWLINAVGATISTNKIYELAATPGILSVVQNYGVKTAEAPSQTNDENSPLTWDGWITNRRIKKASFDLFDTLVSSPAPLPDGGMVSLGQNGTLVIGDTNGSERARLNLSGGPYKSRPTIASDGTIFVAGESRVVYAIRPDGTTLWDYTAKDGASFQSGVAIAPDESRLYVSTTDRWVYALNATTGQQLWRFKTNGDKPGQVIATPVVDTNGTVYIASSGQGKDPKGHLFALDANGNLLWTFVADKKKPFELSPQIGPNGTVYIASLEKSVYAVNADGSLKFRFDTSSKIHAQPAIASDGSLYVAAESGTLYALNGDGTVKFIYQAPTGSFWTSPVLSPDEAMVYVAAKEGKLFAIDANTGTQLWMYTTNGDLLASPGVEPQTGWLHLGNSVGRYAIINPVNGLDLQVFDGTDAITLTPVLAPKDNVFVPLGLQKVEMLGRLPDHWDGRPDVLPTEDKKVWQLVNPVAVDIGADIVHSTTINDKPITGEGVTVAVVDTGVYFSDEVKQELGQQVVKLFVGQVDFVGDGTCPDPGIKLNGKFKNAMVQYSNYCWTNHYLSFDRYGHGSHVAGIIWNNFRDYNTGVYMGIAPKANILSVRVLDDNGQGTYEDVIEGVQFVVENKDVYNIRVMNLSLSGEATTPYFVDPLNRAVEAAWANGIVVVAAAGNSGPGAESVTVPGNDPYVITVGSVNSNRTPGYWADDTLPTWSSAGPTKDGFVKPDVLAPGTQIVSFMYNDHDNMAESAKLVQEHPDYSASMSLFRMNGTSMSTAVTSGVVALMLQAHSELTPDQVKHRLMITAVPAITADGNLLHSPLQQGAGRIWAPAAVLANIPDGNANAGMDIQADLAHGWLLRDENGNPVLDENENYLLDENELAYHYQGPVRRMMSADGQAYLYYVENTEGQLVALGVANTTDMSWLNYDAVTEANMSFSDGQLSWTANDLWAGGYYYLGGVGYYYLGGVGYYYLGGVGYYYLGGVGYYYLGGVGYYYLGGVGYYYLGGVAWSGGYYYLGGVNSPTWTSDFTSTSSISSTTWVDD